MEGDELRYERLPDIVVKSLAGLGWCALVALPAAAYDFPENMPARKPGLWEIVMTGTMDGLGKVQSKEQYCLDTRADRALHELFILRKELQVVYPDLTCQTPRFDRSGNVLSGEMLCRTNSQTDAEDAGKDFRWKYTFESDSHVVLEEHDTARDMLFSGESRMVEEQRWIGECAADQQPGDGIMDRPGKREKGEYDNIYESLKVVRKLLNEGIEINRRLGPM